MESSGGRRQHQVTHSQTHCTLHIHQFSSSWRNNKTGGTNDLTKGWQNLNQLSHPNATLAPQVRASGENLNCMTLARQARPSDEILNYLLSH